MKKLLISLFTLIILSGVPITVDAATDSSQQGITGPSTINATYGDNIKIPYFVNNEVEPFEIDGSPNQDINYLNSHTDGLTFIADYLTGIPLGLGTFHFDISCTYNNQYFDKNITLNVYDPQDITTSSVPRGVFNQKYLFHFQANHPVKGLKWRLPYKNYLPPGLHLSSAGTLYGTPTKTGTYKFAVTVTYPQKFSETATKTYTMQIGFNQKQDITTTSIPVGNLNEIYTPVHFKVYQPVKGLIWKAETSLPKGMHLSSAGTLYGKPTDYGTYHIKIEAGYPYKGSYEYVDQSYTLKINYFNEVFPLSFPNGRLNGKYPTIHLKLYHPIEDPKWGNTLESPPPGLRISSDGTLSGTPTDTGTYTFWIVLHIPTKEGTYAIEQPYTIKITN